MSPALSHFQQIQQIKQLTPLRQSLSEPALVRFPVLHAPPEHPVLPHPTDEAQVQAAPLQTVSDLISSPPAQATRPAWIIPARHPAHYPVYLPESHLLR